MSIVLVFQNLQNEFITRRISTHASRAGQFVSRGFVVLLRKSNPQSHNLQTAAVRGVRAKMNRQTELLLQELCDALASLGMSSDVEDIAHFKAQLGSESPLERRAAAKHISNRCHVKWYGDLNLPVKRAGDYPVYIFLAELQRAVNSEAP